MLLKDFPPTKKRRKKADSHVQLQLVELQSETVFDCVMTYRSDEGFTPAKESLPTNIEPGPDKVPILAERLRNGKPLWHDRDAKQELLFKTMAEFLGADLNDLS